jgi:hypothetical protein
MCWFMRAICEARRVIDSALVWDEGLGVVGRAARTMHLALAPYSRVDIVLCISRRSGLAHRIISIFDLSSKNESW